MTTARKAASSGGSTAHPQSSSNPGNSPVRSQLRPHHSTAQRVVQRITDTTPGIITALTADPRTDTAATTPPPALFADLQAAAIATKTGEGPSWHRDGMSRASRGGMHNRPGAGQ